MTICYIDRTRRYYQALGYGAPYEWARFDDVPFAPLKRPLSETSVAIVTTAAPFQPNNGDQGPGAPYNATAKFFQVYAAPIEPTPDLRISHIAIDRDHTTAEDPGSYFPLAALESATANGRVLMNSRFFGLPTNRSQAATSKDAADLLALCRSDAVEAAIFVPNCPVCHQSCAIASHTLEAAGIPTVVMGAARDIVENVGVSRFLFSDVPLGNAAGLPHDKNSQDDTLEQALRLLETATVARTTRQSFLVWPGPANWRDDYSNPDKLTPKEIATRRAAFDAGKATAKSIRGD